MSEPVPAQIVPPVDEQGDLVDLPNITKTDARTLTSLVRNDYKMLNSELGRRKVALEDEIGEQRAAREAEDRAIANKEMAGLLRRVNNLNQAIVEKLTELRNDGWTHYNYGHRDGFDPHRFTVKLSTEGFMPPQRDNADLQELNRQLNNDFYEASASLDRQEADIVRQLALQSVTSDGAREMILSLPTPESLLSAPQLPA
jgi:hypothetical protein